MRLKKFKIIILLVFFITGLSITGWSISTHWDITSNNSEPQKELETDSQTAKNMSVAPSSNKPILFLISTGLIGLVGIRRQRKASVNFKSPNMPSKKIERKSVELNE